MGEAIDVILATLAAALLPAGAVVTLIARSPGDRCESGAHPPG
jgi:hypothetical protein